MKLSRIRVAVAAILLSTPLTIAWTTQTAEATTSLAPAAGPAGCRQEWLYYAFSPSNSSNVWATSSCNGFYAQMAMNRADSVRGWYYKSGYWQISSYGYRHIGTGTFSDTKIIGNTITDRRLRGEGYAHSQEVLSNW